MKNKQYKAEILFMKKNYERQLRDYKRRYAVENDPYDVGDIIEDHYHIIKIQRKEIVIGNPQRIPLFMYTGVELTKKLVKKKIQKDTVMYQNYVKRKINRR